ncbi:tlde1 domain-containing protein [Methylobacterium brachiatum]
MAQVAYSRPAYRDAAPMPAFAPAPYPRLAYEAPDAPPTRAPYPSAMRRARRRARLTALISLAALSMAGWTVLTLPHGLPISWNPPAPVAEAQPAPESRPAPRPSIAWMLDPSPALGSGAATAFGAPPPAASFQVAMAEPSPAVREIAQRVARKVVQARMASVEPAPAPVVQAPLVQAPAVQAPLAQAAVPPRAAAPVRVAAAEPTPAALAPSLVPLPVARPSELRRPAMAPAPRVAARALPRTRDVFRAAMAEEPSFLEKLFGVGAAAPRAESRQALAYASPDALPQEAPRTRISAAPESVAGTAVYDITARTVTLPSGEVLEAHSGLGEAMDDPRYVHLRMRGSTPPGTYDLTERERLFHGVRAIRLNPVGGSRAIHGRDGLLAHTYMLRQPGASNGCVSFRDYNRFLQAFLRGEVRRLVVVAGSRGDFFGSRVGMVDRPGRRG